ncbi:hypothetical protein ACWD4N_33085 [Streptomyces sp. NPDC002586]
MANQQPTTLTAADLPKGARVTSPEKRTGTVNGVDVGSVTNTEHVNYGREYVGVDWDAIEGDTGCGRRGRPFVDELVIVTGADTCSVAEGRRAVGGRC